MPTWKRNLLVLFAIAAIAGLFLPQAWTQLLRQQVQKWTRPPMTSASMRQNLQVPTGFEIALFEGEADGARMLRVTAAGDLLVSYPHAGRVDLLFRDADGDGHADGRQSLLQDLDRPSGVEVAAGWLFVAETGAVGRIRFDPTRRAVSGSFDRLIKLPAGGSHSSRSLRVGPDGWIYVSVGSSCNVCIEAEPQRAALLRMSLDGSTTETFATGLRNTVGYDWQPSTGVLYGTDNGRDYLGDDSPPCELNKLVAGQFYGWPYAYGDRQPDPDFGRGHAEQVNASVGPAYRFRAHNAPLGMIFLRSPHWPDTYKNAAIVALHGSWNRSRKDGYKVVSLHFDSSGNIESRDFLTGFLHDEEVIGRPVDIAEDPAGSLYISDDYAGSIYRITWTR